MANERGACVSFGVYEFDPRMGELRKHGIRIKLQDKPAALLALLVEKPGELLTHGELHAKLWPEEPYGDPHRLNVAVNKLRAALSDTAANPRFLETLPRRGYRFLAPLNVRPDRAAGSGKKMVAVLPFRNLGSKAEEYFVDGLTEEMIMQLGRANPQRMGVIARTSAISYKGTTKTVRQIGDELGVHYLLEGSVQRHKERLRISAQLIEVAGQSQLWGESYDRRTRDVLAIQREVAERIARSLAVELLPAAPEHARSSPGRYRAYELYLQGRYHWNQRTEKGALAAIEFFQRSVETDPEYALPYTGLADSFSMMGYYGALPPRDAFERAKAAAQTALAIDETLAGAHCSLAFSVLQYDWDWARAEREHQRALALNSNSAAAHHWYGINLTQVGRLREALQSLERALELDPLSAAIQAHIGRVLYFGHQYGLAVQRLERAVANDPGYSVSYYFLGLAYCLAGDFRRGVAELRRALKTFGMHPAGLAALAFAAGASGRRAEAAKTVAQLQELAKQRHVPPYFMAFALASFGEPDEVFGWLEKAYDERYGWLLYLKNEPAFDRVRSDARMLDLIERVDPFRGAGRRAAAGSA